MRVRYIAIMLAVSIAAGAAFGDECSRAEMARAKPHFETGAKAFRVGELQRAADEFKAAYETCPSPLFLYNLGQTYRQLKDDEKAIYFYKQFLSTTPPSDERRDEVQQLVDKLEAHLESHRQQTSAPTVVEPAPAMPASTAPTATAAPQTSTALVSSGAPAAERTPVYKKWWLWAAVGLVAVGVGVGVGLGVGLSRSSTPYTAPGVTF